MIDCEVSEVARPTLHVSERSIPLMELVAHNQKGFHRSNTNSDVVVCFNVFAFRLPTLTFRL